MNSQLLHTSFANCRVGFLLENVFCKLQFGHINEGIRVTGKHAAAGCAVHAALATLCAFAVVVAVDHGTAQLRADLVELVAKMRHLIGAVLVAGDDLVNGVDDDSDVLLFLGTADQAWG